MQLYDAVERPIFTLGTRLVGPGFTGVPLPQPLLVYNKYLAISVVELLVYDGKLIVALLVQATVAKTEEHAIGGAILVQAVLNVFKHFK